MSPVPDSDRVAFFVFIVESPSDRDIYLGRGEGRPLAEVIQLCGVPAVARTAINLEAFKAALYIGLMTEQKARPGVLPILHISAHGNGNGIQLSSGELITWHDLRELMKPLNAALAGSLFLCFSTCEGYSGVRMAMYPEDKELPYFALIGCAKSPTWAEAAVGFATLYHHVAKGEFVADAVAAMRVASGNDAFFLEKAEDSKQEYIEYLATVNSVKVEANLAQLAAQQPKSDMSKALATGEA